MTKRDRGFLQQKVKLEANTSCEGNEFEDTSLLPASGRMEIAVGKGQQKTGRKNSLKPSV